MVPVEIDRHCEYVKEEAGMWRVSECKCMYVRGKAAEDMTEVMSLDFYSNCAGVQNIQCSFQGNSAYCWGRAHCMVQIWPLQKTGHEWISSLPNKSLTCLLCSLRGRTRRRRCCPSARRCRRRRWKRRRTSWSETFAGGARSPSSPPA